MWKILNVISILVVAGAGYVAYLNRDSLAQQKELLGRANKNLEKTQGWYRRAGEVMKERESQRDGLIAEREEAEKQLKQNEADLVTAKAELETVKSAIEEKQADLDAKKTTIKEYGGFEETFTKVEALTNSIASLSTSIADMKQKKAANSATLVGTGAKIKDFENLELWQKSGKMKSLNASVSMFSPEFSFVIIDAGNNRGVVSRAKLDVLRGGGKIAELRVAVVEPTRSICNIESLVGGETIQPGDTVVVSEESKPTDKDAANAKAAATPAAPATGATTPATGTQIEGDGMKKDPAADDPFGDLGADSLDPGTETDAGAGDAEKPAVDGAEGEMPAVDDAEAEAPETGEGAVSPFE